MADYGSGDYVEVCRCKHAMMFFDVATMPVLEGVSFKVEVSLTMNSSKIITNSIIELPAPKDDFEHSNHNDEVSVIRSSLWTKVRAAVSERSLF